MHLVHVLGVAKCIDVSLGPKQASILYKWICKKVIS